MLAQKHYCLDTFPSKDAMKDWANNKVKYVIDY